MTDKELAVLELLRAMNEPRANQRRAAAYDAVFPNNRPWDGRGDAETFHSIADGALLTLLPPEIVKAFNSIEKWYA